MNNTNLIETGAKKMDKRQNKYYMLGQEYAAKYDNIRTAIWHMPDDQGWEMASDNTSSCWFSAGFFDKMPEWVETERYGEIPPNGKSKNHATGEIEKGVSTLYGIPKSRLWIYEMWYKNEKPIKIGGWNFGHTGSDGETLLIDCVKIG